MFACIYRWLLSIIENVYVSHIFIGEFHTSVLEMSQCHYTNKMLLSFCFYASDLSDINLDNLDLSSACGSVDLDSVGGSSSNLKLGDL